MRYRVITVGFAVFLVVMMITSAAAAAPASTGSTAAEKKPGFSWQKACTKNPAVGWLPVCDLLNLVNTEIANRQAADAGLQAKIAAIPAGQSCWDLNNTRKCDTASEDTSADGSCTVADCKGPQGEKGDTGATGATGPQGPQGPAGTGSGSAIAIVSGVRDNNGPVIIPGISTPEGYTTDQCNFFVSVEEIRCPIQYPLYEIKTGYEITGSEYFDVYALGSCRMSDELVAFPEVQKARYVVICQK